MEWQQNPTTAEILNRIQNRIEEFKEQVLDAVVSNPTDAQRIAWLVVGYRDVLELIRDGDDQVKDEINPRELE